MTRGVRRWWLMGRMIERNLYARVRAGIHLIGKFGEPAGGGRGPEGGKGAKGIEGERKSRKCRREEQPGRYIFRISCPPHRLI